MNADAFLEYDWPYILALLPDAQHLEETASSMGALRRRRNVDSASSLLKLVFAYGFLGFSLRQTAAWAQTAGVAELSDVALLKRLKAAADWLGHLVDHKLAERAAAPSSLPYNLRLIDATVISRPGSAGLDWRVHLVYDLARLRLRDVEFTDARGGETLTRFRWRRNDLVIGDRGYAHRRGLGAVAAADAFFVLRLNWQNVPLQDEKGQPFSIVSFLRGLPEAAAGEAAVHVAPEPDQAAPPLSCRLVALRKSEAAAAAARQRALNERRQKGKVNPLTLETAGYVFLLTNLPPAVTAEQILDLYRFRWQIEVAFKRLKGLVSLGEMPAKDPQLTRCIVYAKLLAALLVDDLTDRFLAFFPWGYRLPTTSALSVENPEGDSGFAPRGLP